MLLYYAGFWSLRVIDLPSSEAHLWWAFPDNIQDAAVLARQMAVLSAEERARQSRFYFERGRHEYLVAHALVRDALSRHAPVPPDAWRFETNEYGRPSIATPAEWANLKFNLSHTRGRIVVAVARDLEIGVDVECANRTGDLESIADRFFSPLEVEQLKAAPELFFDFWTLKESYIKARGMGLSIPLDSFSFCLTDPAHPRISFHAGCVDQPERWQFVLWRRGEYRAALAVAGAGKLRVIEREIVPMA